MSSTDISSDISARPNQKRLFYRTTTGKIRDLYWGSGQWNDGNMSNAGTNASGDVKASNNECFYVGSANHAVYKLKWNYSLSKWERSTVAYLPNNTISTIEVSLDGDFVYYMSDYKIYCVQKINGSYTTSLVTASPVEGDFAVSPDNKRVFFVHMIADSRYVHAAKRSSSTSLSWSGDGVIQSQLWTGSYTYVNLECVPTIPEGKLVYSYIDNAFPSQHRVRNIWKNSAGQWADNELPSSHATGKLGIASDGKIFYKRWKSNVGSMTDMYFNNIYYVPEKVAVGEGVSISGEGLDLEVYPNPIEDGEVYFTAKENIQLVSFVLINSRGVIIAEDDVFEFGSIDVSDFDPGFYLLKVKTETGEELIEKIVIK